MRDSLLIPVTESSQVGEARRAAAWLARKLGFNETEAGKVTIVAAEAASNLARHTSGGELLLRSVELAGINGIEILSLDRGPGMASVADALRDGYSTAGSSGIGLGGMVRLSAVFDVYSLPAIGTAVLARLWAGPLPRPLADSPLETGLAALPKPGQQVNGDSWAIHQLPNRGLLMIADGLGHGQDAASASQQAVQVMLENLDLGPVALLQAIHTALRSTRGAAVAIAEVDTVNEQVCYAGVGNIIGGIEVNGTYRGMVSHHGTAGYEVHKTQGFTYPMPRGALLIMHSDGLSGRWNFDRYPGLLQKDTALVAGVLYRDYGRRTDDATVIVARLRA